MQTPLENAKTTSLIEQHLDIEVGEWQLSGQFDRLRYATRLKDSLRRKYF